MKRNIALAAVAAFTLSACSGLKDALNAHTDWVARAGSAELSVTKLANLLGKSRAPVRKDIANMKARKWYDVVSKGWGVEDTAAAKRQWESGQVLAADHILLLTQGMNDAQKAGVKKK